METGLKSYVNAVEPVVALRVSLKSPTRATYRLNWHLNDDELGAERIRSVEEYRIMFPLQQTNQ